MFKQDLDNRHQKRENKSCSPATQYQLDVNNKETIERRDEEAYRIEKRSEKKYFMNGSGQRITGKVNFSCSTPQ